MSAPSNQQILSLARRSKEKVPEWPAGDGLLSCLWIVVQTSEATSLHKSTLSAQASSLLKFDAVQITGAGADASPFEKEPVLSLPKEGLRGI